MWPAVRRLIGSFSVSWILFVLLNITYPVALTRKYFIWNFRQKLGGGNQNESVLVQNLANGLALEFECSDPTRRLRLLLSELLLVMAQVKPKWFIHCLLIQVQGWTDFYFKVNDFQNSVQLSKFLLIEATFCFQHLKKNKDSCLQIYFGSSRCLLFTCIQFFEDK